MKNKFLLVLLLVPFMFLVTACGDDDGDGGDEAPLEAVPELLVMW